MKNLWHIGRSESIDSLSINKFDLTCFNDQEYIPNLNNYYVTDTHPLEKIKDDRKDIVLYRYNSSWFRSDHFLKKHDGMHILFSGCSNTEGLGLNQDRTWAKILHDKINDTVKTSGFFSIARSGYGWQQIINNFQVYVSKYGAPDFFFILMPNLIRYHKWVENKNTWKFIQKHTWHKDRDTSEFMAPTVYEHRMLFPFWATSWNLFMSYCDSIGTKVIWSTWDNNEIKNIKDLNIKNFFEIPDIDSKKFNNFLIKNNSSDIDSIEGRDGHPGYLQNLFWAENFYEKFIEQYNQ